MDPSASHTTEHDRLLIWIKLCLTPRLGIQSLLKLVSKVPLDSLSDYSEQEWFALGLTPTQITYLLSSAAKQVAEDCLEWQERGNHRHILTYFSPDYPALLKEIPSPPPLLFAQGDITLLSVPQMAIVGSRHASMQGLQDAWHFANEFAQHQVAVTSGLALGIDGQAHLGALDGGGKTIAVLGAGLARIYPARHRGLAERMLEQQSGVLVSEFCPSTPPKSQNFPRRNRIISGLSLGVLVIEAAEKSGSLITARYAAEQNRDVFVIPGAIHQHGYRGSNALIRDGACLVQNIEQILSEVGTLSAWVKEEEKQADKIQQNELFPPLIDDEELPFAELLANVGVKATPVDILAARTHIPVHEVMRQLLELELSGHVIAVAGGYIRKGRG